MRYTHFPTPWDELCSSQRVRFYTVLSSGTRLQQLQHLVSALINNLHSLPDRTITEAYSRP